MVKVENKHLKSSLQSTASWNRDSSGGLSGDICISRGRAAVKECIEHFYARRNLMTAVFSKVANALVFVKYLDTFFTFIKLI